MDVMSRDFTVSAADSVIIYASEYFDACGNDSSGIFLQPSGSWPFTYQWSTGDTTSYVWGPTPGLVSVTVTDALGCSASYSTIVPDSNDCVELFGSVFLDDNANCLQDGNDAGRPTSDSYHLQQVVTLINIIDASGSYSIRVPEDNYDVESTAEQQLLQSNMCAFYPTKPHYLSWSQLDFWHQIDSSWFKYLSVSITAFSIHPGFPYYNYIQYCNDGLLPMSGTVELTMAPIGMAHPKLWQDIITIPTHCPLHPTQQVNC